ncbi:MAG: hypothetical protein Q9168_005011 [Polycauliona sp. 1 TL-2023]
METHISIEPVRSRTDLLDTKGLFLAYAESLGIDLSFQDFQTELETLPGKYAAPLGELLMARDVDGSPLGCVAIRPMPEDGCCEMKRLYVAPAGRGRGVGRMLAAAVMDAAISLTYSEVKLDTLPSMAAALALYERLGFRPTDPYYHTPIPGTRFLARKL